MTLKSQPKPSKPTDLIYSLVQSLSPSLIPPPPSDPPSSSSSTFAPAAPLPPAPPLPTAATCTPPHHHPYLAHLSPHLSLLRPLSLIIAAFLLPPSQHLLHTVAGRRLLRAVVGQWLADGAVARDLDPELRTYVIEKRRGGGLARSSGGLPLAPPSPLISCAIYFVISASCIISRMIYFVIFDWIVSCLVFYFGMIF